MPPDPSSRMIRMILYPAKVVPLSNGMGRCYTATAAPQSPIAQALPVRSRAPKKRAGPLCCRPIELAGAETTGSVIFLAMEAWCGRGGVRLV